MPAGAVELPPDFSGSGERAMAVAALRKLLSSRGAGLPLGPETAAEEEGRMLSLNRFALQLVTGGIAADQLAVERSPWLEQARAPQLLLSALVDEENAVVAFGGVLTGAEFIALATRAARSGDDLLLEAAAFQGGIERLLTLVQLLEPAALPRLALPDPALAGAVLAGAARAGEVVVAVADWLEGRVDGALSALGAVLMPAALQPAAVQPAAVQPGLAGAGMRSAAVAGALEGTTPLAVLAIPLGLMPDGRLVTGEEARQCIETLQLLLIPSSGQGDGESPEALILKLTGAIPGDLLPDGIELTAEQGRHRQSASSQQSTDLALCFRGGDPIAVMLSSAAGEPLRLPPLQLPSPQQA